MRSSGHVVRASIGDLVERPVFDDEVPSGHGAGPRLDCPDAQALRDTRRYRTTAWITLSCSHSNLDGHDGRPPARQHYGQDPLFPMARIGRLDQDATYRHKLSR